MVELGVVECWNEITFMTKYILHGGAASKKTQDNKSFFREAVTGLQSGATILCVYFSRQREKWPQMLEQDTENFCSISEQKDLNMVVASEAPDIFIDQIKQADVVYLRGGETEMLQQALEKIQKFENLLKDKVVCASSAGVYVVSSYYYSNTRQDIFKGLGILPIKTLCHYSDEKQNEREMLENYGEDLKVYALPEEKFVVIED